MLMYNNIFAAITDSGVRLGPESIKIFTEGQAFLVRSYDPAPRPPPFPLSRQPVDLTDGGGGGARGWALSQIIRPRESLALYEPFNTLSLSFKDHRRNISRN
jgi:hypothetical protein